MSAKQKERSPAQIAAMAKMRAVLAEKRASGEITVGRKKGTRVKKRAPAEPAWTFNVDDKGELAIVDTNDGSGIELKVSDAQRLRTFLSRALPPEAEVAIERIRTRESADA